MRQALKSRQDINDAFFGWRAKRHSCRQVKKCTVTLCAGGEYGEDFDKGGNCRGHLRKDE